MGLAGDSEPVVVVGGGIAGLACAVALVDAGIPVRLYEGSVRFGGRAQSIRDDVMGDIVDIGPHVVTTEHRNMLSLLCRLGTDSDICWQPDRFITLIDDGQPVRMRNYPLAAPFHFLPNFFHVEKLSMVDIWSARRVLWRVMRMSEADVLAIDDRDAEAVLREMGVTEQFIDWFWRTVCMAIMNVPLEQCSAGSLFRFLKMMSGRTDFYFGFPKVPLADLFAPGSVQRIREAGGEARCETAVRAIDINDAAHDVVLENGEKIGARQCVLAVPPAAAAPLLPDADALDADLAAFEPSPYISTYLWFDRKLTSERFWARRWAPGNLNYDFYDLSNIRADRHDTSLIATNIIFAHHANERDDDELVSATVSELAEFLPEARQATLRHARVHRIGMAIAAPHPGFEKSRPATRTRVRGLYLAGDWIQTFLPESMESAVRSGFLAAEAVAADRGVQLSLALPLRPMKGLAGWLRRRAALRED